MSPSVQSVMNTPAVALASHDSVAQAARLMSEHQVGSVLVVDDENVTGIVTDRDLALRVLAPNLPATTPVADVCTEKVTSLSPQDDVQSALRTMREVGVRRLPVIENGRLVGALSLGDIAITDDAGPTLRDICATPANN
jgi:CBS domain-containing protein